MTRRVLVSGASGFIGRWSVAPLLRAGYEVHAVVRDAARHPRPPQLQNAELHGVDLLDAGAVAALIAAVEPSHLLHFAWIATPGVYWTSPDNSRWLAAGRHLLQCFEAHGGRRAVMAGSCAEYDWSRVGVCHEFTSPPADEGREGAAAATATAITPYTECKLAMHEALSQFGSVHGLSTAWGRIFFLYGPDEHPDRLVASAITHLLAGQEALCSHGRQVRSFLHAADVGAAFAALLDSPIEGPVNIGSGDRIAIADLVGLAAAQIGRPDLVRLGARTASPTEPPVLVPDIRRLRDEVGWSPRYTLSTGLADTIGWWRQRLALAPSAALR